MTFNVGRNSQINEFRPVFRNSLISVGFRIFFFFIIQFLFFFFLSYKPLCCQTIVTDIKAFYAYNKIFIEDQKRHIRIEREGIIIIYFTTENFFRGSFSRFHDNLKFMIFDVGMIIPRKTLLFIVILKIHRII